MNKLEYSRPIKNSQLEIGSRVLLTCFTLFFSSFADIDQKNQKREATGLVLRSVSTPVYAR